MWLRYVEITPQEKAKSALSGLKTAGTGLADPYMGAITDKIKKL